MKNNHEYAKTKMMILKNDLAIKNFVIKAIEAAKKNNFQLSKNYLKKIDTKNTATKKIYNNYLVSDLEENNLKKTILTLFEDHFFSIKALKKLSKEVINLYILMNND